MRNTFISIFAVLTILLTVSIKLASAQDSTKKTVAQKPAVVKPNLPPGYVKPYSKYHHYYKAKAVPGTPAAANPATPAPTGTTPTSTAPAIVNQPVATPDSAVPNDKSLNGQYKYLLSKLYRYQQPLVSALWKNITDTLNASRRRLSDAGAKVSAQSKTISTLQSAISSKDQTLLSSTTKSDEIDLLGVPLTKSTYNIIMWGLVIVLGITAGIVIARTGSFKHEADYRKKLYNELEEEYKTFKAKANEKEKKLARELQTERNKIDELMGRG